MERLAEKAVVDAVKKLEEEGNADHARTRSEVVT